ncbi:MAG TPA: polyprenyl synthetase family protein [Terriglobales bacterium]|nr:polyprenyl synthetase family protein [Terriglobales bacterium]
MNPAAPTLAELEADLLAPFRLVRTELEQVEAELLAGGESRVPAITAIGRHLQQSGGKRIRAALVLLAGRLAGCEPRARVRLAAIVEMIHAATLIHDDIIDEAPTRRGRPSANARWGNPMCVLAGDWLYMQSFRLALGERHFGVLDALISLTQDMVEGELLQLEMQQRVVTAAEHTELIERKTARLFEVAAQLGAMAAGQPAAVIAALGEFGIHLGRAFQMVDDLLDFTAAAAALGKPVGNDLREGKMTLPAIYAHQASDAAGRAQLEQVMREGGYQQVGFEQVQALVASTGGLERARGESRQQAALALAALEALPASPEREALALLPALVVERSQ